MLAFLLAVFLRVAIAANPSAVPVQLPVGEAEAGWSDILTATGLTVGTPAGWGVVMSDAGNGSTWNVRIVNKAGKIQDLAVLIPTNAQEREDLAWYLAKLAGAAPPAVLPIAPAPLPPVADPVATVAAPSPTAPAAAPTATTTTSTAPLGPSDSEPSTLGLFARVGGQLDIRGRSSVAFSPELALGVHVGPVRVGALGALHTMSGIASAGEGRGFSSLEFGGGAWFAPQFPVGGGIVGGLALRAFHDEGAAVQTIPVPFVGGEVIGRIPLVSKLSVEPMARFQVDTRSVEIIVGGADPEVLPGWELRLGVGLTWN